MSSRVLILWLMAGPALADIGAAGGLSLLEPLSARTAALGDAVSAEPGRADALGDNPAGLAAQPGFAGSALYHAGFAGDTWVSVTGGAPLPDGFGAGAGVALYNGGTVEALDPTGHLNPVTAQRDLAGRAGLAWQAPGWPVRAGVAATVISSQLLEDVSALQVATDWGLQAAWPAAHLAAGAALQHLGGHLRYDTGKEPLDNNHLPALWRFGLAWTIDLSETPGSIGLLESAEHPDYLKGPVAQGAGLYAEAQARTTERAVQYAAGMEYTVAGLLSFRAGARTLGSGIAARLSVPTFGLGIAVKAIVVDYAVELLPVAAIHRIGLTVRAAPKAD